MNIVNVFMQINIVYLDFS